MLAGGPGNLRQRILQSEGSTAPHGAARIHIPKVIFVDLIPLQLILREKTGSCTTRSTIVPLPELGCLREASSSRN